MMGSFRRSARAAVALALTATLGAACGGSAGAAECNTSLDTTKGKTINLPPSLGGLRVDVEKKATTKLLKESKVNSYLCDGRIFSLREGTELRAVLQVGRLTPDARPEEKEFRKTVADGMQAKRAPEKIGETLVYKGNFNKQLIQVWFVEHFMVVLTVRESATVAGEPVGVDFDGLTTEALSLRPVAV